jgi:hypothetical protein
MTLRGIFHVMCEQGVGAFYAFQDERFIKPPTEEWPHESWSYDGLHQIKTGDHIKALNEDGSVYWEGDVSTLSWRNAPVWEDGWVTQEQWGTIFHKELKGEFTRNEDGEKS